MVSRSRSNTASTMAAPMPFAPSSASRARTASGPRANTARSTSPIRVRLWRDSTRTRLEFVHRVERMILQRAFAERHRADEQIALVNGAAGAGKSRGHQHDRIAAIGAQRIHHRPDIAGVGGIEGRADLEQHVVGPAAAQPLFGGARARHRKARFDRPALERHHHRVDVRQHEIAGRHADGLHRAQPASGQRVGQIGRAGIVVGNAAQRQCHGFAPA